MCKWINIDGGIFSLLCYCKESSMDTYYKKQIYNIWFVIQKSVKISS